MPRRTMSSGARPESVSPQKLTLPVSALTAPVIEKSSVDLPAPLGPTMPTNSPSSTAIETPRNAAMGP